MARPKQTHCSRGHKYTPKTEYVLPGGGRRCLICLRQRNRKQGIIMHVKHTKETKRFDEILHSSTSFDIVDLAVKIETMGKIV